MAELKYKFPIYEIVDEDGSLKFLFNYETDNMLNIGEQIIVLSKNENGDFTHRYYFIVTHKIAPTVLDEEENKIYNEENLDFIIYVKKQIDEPVL